MSTSDLVPHLFRTEFRKIISVLVRRFGAAHLEIMEDVVAETFLAALNVWPYQGVPDKPTSWLYAVAKNKALNYFAREKLFDEKVASALADGPAETSIDLSEENVFDSELRMMFAICHPGLPRESQIALALKILFGLSIEEIADAFLTSKDTINKRLYRAKECLRMQGSSLEFPAGAEFASRLGSVVETLYLLFSEGYYSESNERVLREDLCLTAMRLTHMLTSYPPTDQPEVNALLALMCFHASRFPARKGDNGEIILYEDQDDTLWDRELVEKGAFSLKKASAGNHLSRYHLEAAIAFWHTRKEDTTEKWESILQLYNRLLMISYSPIAALNRTYALSKAKGKEVAIEEATKLKIEQNPYYFALLGELYHEIDEHESLRNYRLALGLARTEANRKIIQGKIEQILANSETKR